MAAACGVRAIWTDPGLGFYYKGLPDGDARVRHQLHAFLTVYRLRGLGWPVCMALPHAFHCFEDEVLSSEPFFAVWAALGGTSLIRTHEVNKVGGVLRAMQCYLPSSEEAAEERVEERGCGASTPVLCGEALQQQLGLLGSQQWRVELRGDGQMELQLTCTTPSYHKAIALMNLVSETAQELNHHPNMSIAGTSCDAFSVTLALSSMAPKGISSYDIQLAQEINGHMKSLQLT